MFSIFRPKQSSVASAAVPAEPELMVTEGVAGMWHYHISRNDAQFYRALCSAQVMRTSIRVADWGVVFGEHFPKRPTWCAICAQHLAKHCAQRLPQSPPKEAS